MFWWCLKEKNILLKASCQIKIDEQTTTTYQLSLNDCTMYQLYLIKEIKNSHNLKGWAVILHKFYWYWILSSVLITCYVKACTLLVDPEYPLKIGFSTIWRSHRLSHLILYDILLHIPVHDQLKHDVLKHMVNNECTDLGMEIVIFIV